MSIKVPEQPPAGEYPARFKYLRDGGEGQFGSQWNWGLDGEVDGEIIEYTAISSQRMGPNSKPGRWIATLLGRKLEPGEEWRTLADLEKDLSGKPCTIKAEENDRGFVNVTEVKARTDPEIFVNVTTAKGRVEAELSAQPVRKARLSAEETEPF